MRVTRQRIELGDRLDFVAKKFEPDSFFIGAARINFDHVAPDAEPAPPKIHVVTLV